MNIQEGVASISDKDGNLLFYSDGIRIWDRTHQIMNAENLSGSYTSTQSVVIVPDLSNEKIFFVFTAGAGQSAQFNYSKVDLTLPGNGTLMNPLGEIDSSFSDINLLDGVGEKITYILKPSNTGYWVLTHGFGDNRFYAFDIDCNGVNPNPIITDIGVTYTGSFHESGYMRSTRDGTKLALVNSSKRGVFLYDFNLSTGKVSNEYKITPKDDNMYGIEFSPSGRYLFIAEPHSISRFDLTTFLLSDVTIDKPQLISDSNKLKAVQVGPDGKIYIAITNKKYLSVIEDPESTIPSMLVDKISLGGKFNGWGLPDIYYKYIHPNDSLTLKTCSGSSIDFEGEIYNANTINEIKVPSGIGCDSSLLILTIDTFPTSTSFFDTVACAGSYLNYNGSFILAGSSDDIVLKDANGCDSIVTVFVESRDFVSKNIDTLICPGSRLIYHQQEFNSGIDTSFLIEIENACDTLLFLKINDYPKVTFEVETSNSCWNQNTGSATATITNGQSAPYLYSLDAQNFSSDAQLTDLFPGIQSYYIKDQNQCIYEELFEIAADPIIDVNIPSPTFPCDENEILIEAELINGENVTWQWPDNSNQDFYFTHSFGPIEVTLSNHCETLTRVIDIPLEDNINRGNIYIPGIFSPNSDGFNDAYHLGFSNSLSFEKFHFQVYDRWGSLVFTSDDPNFSWSGTLKGKEVCQGVYTWILKASFMDCHQLKTLDRFGELTIIR